jgi:biopolymer transport protein TolR
MRQRQRKRPMAEINIVPYIDVMLVLLVIFMIATPLLTQGVKVNLPTAKANPIETKQELPLVVTVDANGNYYVNTESSSDTPLSAQALAIRVAAELQISQQKGATRQVLVKGDRAVPYGKVVQAMVLLQKSGVAEVGLMTDDNS